MTAKLYFVHALSPLHSGTGQGVGAIDLPVAREKATGLPYQPGSSLKGVLRAGCTDAALRTRIFGPDTEHAEEHAGSAQFSDARLLLLPVRSLSGTFAWVTSPYLLRRLLRDGADAGAPDLPKDVPCPADESRCLVATRPCAVAPGHGDGTVYLEDLDLSSTADQLAADWATWLGARIFPADLPWQQILRSRLCVVHDDILSFLAETATEVAARIRLREDAKTVEKGGLWYEEALPAETVLYGVALATPLKATVKEVFDMVRDLTKATLQLGGKATVGRGLCRVHLA